jgi:hypothetical protein
VCGAVRLVLVLLPLAVGAGGGDVVFEVGDPLEQTRDQ